MSDASLLNPINLLPGKLKNLLGKDDYDYLRFTFGLEVVVPAAQIHQELSKITKQKKEQKRLTLALQNLKVALETNEEALWSEIQLLHGVLKDVDNYVNSFNTEAKLLGVVKERYGIADLNNKQIGCVILLFQLFNFERFDIADCEIFWKLTDNDYNVQKLINLCKISLAILQAKIEPVEYAVLSYEVAAKNSKSYPDEAVLRFLLSINKHVDFIKDKDEYQIYFHELNIKYHPYRILLENAREMPAKEIEDEIIRKFRSKGLSQPNTPAGVVLSREKSLYAQGIGGWGLVKWGTAKQEVDIILENWFRETKSPATRDEMISYIKTLRPDLADVSIGSQISTKTKTIEVISSTDKTSRKKLYYHRDVLLPEGFEKVRSTRSSTKSGSGVNKNSSNLPVVFISYSHTDDKWRKEFREHLDGYKEKITIWDDTQIASGSVWEDEIKTGLDKAQVALFLVTPEFKNSNYIQSKEFPKLLKRALNKQVKIFWVLAEAVDFQNTELAKIQAAYSTEKDLASMSKSERRVAVMKICAEIMQAATNNK